MSKSVAEIMQDVVNKIKKDIRSCEKMVDNYDQPRVIKDSGNRREFETGSVRDMQEGKGRCDLLPAAALLRLSKHYEEGSKKYGDRNWEKGQPISVMIDSGMRHLLKYLDGQKDEDHLTAAAWNILGAMWMEDKHPELQDIPSRMEQDVEEYDDFGPLLDNDEEPVHQLEFYINDVQQMTTKLINLFSLKEVPKYLCDIWGRAYNEGRVSIELFNAAQSYYLRSNKWENNSQKLYSI